MAARGGGFGPVFGGRYEGSFGGQYGGEGGFLLSPSETSEVSLLQNNATNSGTRTTDSRHMFPFTVSLIKRSYQKNTLIDYSDFFGEEVRHVFLVGLVQNLDIDGDSEKWSFKLFDGTGSILVEWCPGDRRNYDEHGESPWSQQRLDRITNGVYVDLRGSVSMLGKTEPAIRAYDVKRVSLPEEIFAHQIHVAQEIIRRIYPEAVSPMSPNDDTTALRKGPLGDIAHSATGDYSSSTTTSRAVISPQARPASTFATKVPFGVTAQPQPPLSGVIRDIPPMGQGQNRHDETVSNTVLTALRNSSKARPDGLTADQILLALSTHGIEIDSAELQRICRLLINQNRAYESERGKWKLTDF